MKTAILIPCYNRPRLLEQVMADLLNTPQVRMGTPVILACDGGENATIVENLTVATKARIPMLHCLIRPSHFGVGRNVYEAKRYIFEDCRFDQCFYIEDDIRVSPHILTHLLHLQRWLKVNYTSIAVISTATFCTITKEEKAANLALVSDCGYSLCNHLMNREGWCLMRPWMQVYVDHFLQCSYADRDNASISAWMRQLAQRLPVQSGNRMFPAHWPFKEYFLESPVTSQDGAMALALRLAGLSHVVSAVNRAWHIGRKGENTTEDVWKQTWGSTTLDVFEEDNTRTVFRVRA